MRAYLTYLILALLSLSQIVSAQSLLGPTNRLWEGMEVGADGFSGVLLRHRPDQMTFALPQSFWALSLEMRKQMLGQRYWQGLYNYPKLGWTFLMQSFGNDQVLGRSYSLYPFLDLDLVKRGNLSLSFRVGYSFAWLPKKFDIETNPENTAIGSRLNNLTMLGLFAEYRFAERWYLRAGGQFTHTSNARYKQPNLGLNTAKLRFGLSYQLKPVESLSEYPYDEYPLAKRWRPFVRFGLAGKEQKVAGGPRYLAYSVSAGAGWMYSRKNQLQLGMMLVYDRAIEAFMIEQEIPFRNENPNFRPIRPALLVGHEFLFGRVGVLTQTFWYLDKPFVGEEFMGFQIGPSIYWKQPQHWDRLNFFAGIYLKAHKAVADYVELTVGFGW
ncbi:MAG: acyloxyacyl hydrolase [Bacteroidota bacterium]